MWVVTKVKDGRPVDGACSIRYTAEKQAEAADALVKIAQALSQHVPPEGKGN
jgi:hypothetical protein